MPRSCLHVVLMLSLAACAHRQPAPDLPEPPRAPDPAQAPAPVEPAPRQPAPVTPPPVSPAVPPATTAAPKAVTGKMPAAKHGPPVVATNQSPKPKPGPTPPAAAAKPAVATLNLTELEQRLRDTKAIGVFTKLSLKNQVDDLLGDFRALYKEQRKEPPAEFRARYDSLLAKVLSLLQSGDPQLAQSIASSREAIWGILSDPDKFSKI